MNKETRTMRKVIKHRVSRVGNIKHTKEMIVAEKRKRMGIKKGKKVIKK